MEKVIRFELRTLRAIQIYIKLMIFGYHKCYIINDFEKKISESR